MRGDPARVAGGPGEPCQRVAGRTSGLLSENERLRRVMASSGPSARIPLPGERAAQHRSAPLIFVVPTRHGES